MQLGYSMYTASDTAAQFRGAGARAPSGTARGRGCTQSSSRCAPRGTSATRGSRASSDSRTATCGACHVFRSGHTDTHAHSFAHGAHQKSSTPEKESAREKNENVIQYVSLPWHTQGRQGHTHTAYRTPRTGAQAHKTHRHTSACHRSNPSSAMP
jgi:hypothetical protein